MIKKIIAFILITLLLPLHPVLAKEIVKKEPNWVKIVADNGESADLDLNSIAVALDTVEYDIKTEKDENGFFFVRHISTELYKDETPSAVMSLTKYKDEISEDTLIEKDVYTDLEYKPAIDGTLSAEIFSVLSKNLNLGDFRAGDRAMKRYLHRQYGSIKKQWRPRHYKEFSKNEARHLPTGSKANVYYENTIYLKLDKNGKVISRDADDLNGLHTEISEFPPLPKDYPGETYNINLKLRCYKYYGAGKYTSGKVKIIKENPNTASLIMAKNHFPPVIGPILLGVCKFSNILMKPIDFFSDHMPFLIIGVPYTVIATLIYCIFIQIPFGWLGEDVGS